MFTVTVHAQQKSTARPATAATNRASSDDAVEPVRTLRGRMNGNIIEARMIDDRHSFDYRLTTALITDGRLELEGIIVPARRFANGSTSSAPVRARLVSTLAKFRQPSDPAGLKLVENYGATSNPNAQTASPQTATQVTQGTATARRAAGENVAQQQGGAATNPETAARDGQLAQATQSAAGTPAGTPTAPGGTQPAAATNRTLTEQITAAPVQTAALAGAGDNMTTGCEVMFMRLEIPAQFVAQWEQGTQPVQLGVMVSSLDNKIGSDLNQSICRIVRMLDDKQNQTMIDAEVARLNQILGSAK